jgi:hypothetical protein
MIGWGGVKEMASVEMVCTLGPSHRDDLWAEGPIPSTNPKNAKSFWNFHRSNYYSYQLTA